MSGRISDSTVRRLSLYLRMLRDLERAGAEFVSSSQLAEPSGATSAQVRKDLSHFGSFGKRGRGYSVDGLVRALEEILGLSRTWKIALVGVGKIGSALLGYGGLAARGFDVVAAFDVDGAKVGTTAYGLRIRPMTELRSVIAECGAEIGVVAAPPGVGRAGGSGGGGGGCGGGAPPRRRWPPRSPRHSSARAWARSSTSRRSNSPK